MNDDYLWDGSGEPDPEIQRLESALGRFRHNRPAPVFPEMAKSGPAGKNRGLAAVFRLRWAVPAVTCSAIVAIAALGLFLVRSKPVTITASDWNVTDVHGAPRLAGASVHESGETGNLGFGQVLETDSASRVKIRAEQTGEIDVEPGTRLRVLASRPGLQRLELQKGTIHVTIWAEPGRFVVDTPSAVAVDLGCVYTLTVDSSGNGLLRTSMGWVGFRLENREAFIPAGAACVTTKKTGPGTPYFEDAAPALRHALPQLDAPGASDEERAAALHAVLEHAREHDALTLWHLLSRVPVSDRGLVYDRLAVLAPPPSSATREGILRLDQQMLDLWWNELGLGDISLWRHWERSWSQEAARSK